MNYQRLFHSISQHKSKEAAWQRGLFILDANIFLNLYRYKDEHYLKSWLHVLNRIKQRLWVPHNVLLEFQFNHRAVSAEYLGLDESDHLFHHTAIDILKCAGEIESLVEPAKELCKRPSGPVSEAVLEKMRRLNRAESMISVIRDDMFTIIEKDEQYANFNDDIKCFVEQLLRFRVGEAPTGQAELDQIYQKAEERFRLGIPPGFMDQHKEPDCRVHGGLSYQLRYGDYLLWHQILEYMPQSNAKHLIFVTDDVKEDWWKIEDGKFQAEPRPELVQEILSQCNLDSFFMYTADQFMKQANKMICDTSYL